MIFLAQCVMCARNAAAQQTARAQVLNEAIFIIGVPSLAILIGFAYFVYRRR